MARDRCMNALFPPASLLRAQAKSVADVIPHSPQAAVQQLYRCTKRDRSRVRRLTLAALEERSPRMPRKGQVLHHRKPRDQLWQSTGISGTFGGIEDSVNPIDKQFELLQPSRKISIFHLSMQNTRQSPPRSPRSLSFSRSKMSSTINS